MTRHSLLGFAVEKGEEKVCIQVMIDTGIRKPPKERHVRFFQNDPLSPKKTDERYIQGIDDFYFIWMITSPRESIHWTPQPLTRRWLAVKRRSQICGTISPQQ